MDGQYFGRNFIRFRQLSEFLARIILTIRATEKFYIPDDTSPFPGVAHWASLWGKPQHWHAKRACVTPNKKEKKERNHSAITWV